MSLYEIFLQNVLFPMDAYRSRKGKLFAYLKEFEKSQFLSAEEMKNLSWRRLKTIIQHAYDNIPYYRQSFTSAGITPQEIESENDLLRLPILEKRQVQNHLGELVAANWSKNDLIPDQTGGSTGTPVKYFYSNDRLVSREAATYRHNRWAGWDICSKSAALWGASRDIQPPTVFWNRLHHAVFNRQIIFNTATFNESDVLQFNETLKKYRPQTILGYANALTVFAQVLKDRNVSAYNPFSIVSSAEMLTPENRELVENVFGCRVFNRYGSRETSVIASECECHEGLHLMAEGLYLELVVDGRHAKPGEMGEILITDLLNFPMPFIRYRIGDMAVWAEKPCSCGRGLPMLEKLTGRVTDFLVTDNGSLCSGASLTALVVAKRPSLKQIQIYQERQGEVLYRIASGKDRPIPDADLNFIREQSATYLGKGTTVSFEFVDEIPKTASGKNLFSISKAVEYKFAEEK
jgi:phenylacetate-CoA ligase